MRALQRFAFKLTVDDVCVTSAVIEFGSIDIGYKYPAESAIYIIVLYVCIYIYI